MSDDYDELRHHLDRAASAAGSQLAHIREAQEALDRLSPPPVAPAPANALLVQRPGQGAVTRASLGAAWGASVSEPTGNTEHCSFTANGTRHRHHAGRNGPGLNYAVSMPSGHRRATARWRVTFEPGFSFGSKSIGGKVGGLGVGDVVVGGNGTPERLAAGGSLRLTWHGDERGNVVWRPYVYHRGQGGRFGDGALTAHVVPVGRPIDIAMSVDVPRGIGRIVVNGLVISDERYDWPANVEVTKALAHLYHGGGTDDFGPATDCWSRLESFVVEGG